MAANRSRRGRGLPPADVLSLDDVKHKRGRQKGCDNSRPAVPGQSRPAKRRSLPHQEFQSGHSGFRRGPKNAAQDQQTDEAAENQQKAPASDSPSQLQDHFIASAKQDAQPEMIDVLMQAAEKKFPEREQSLARAHQEIASLLAPLPVAEAAVAMAQGIQAYHDSAPDRSFAKEQPSRMAAEQKQAAEIMNDHMGMLMSTS
ncbi:hypothetical protein WJX74_008359 [Apatococcus lobatus]|uniref:Uncharacterized protein n=1 Tax=Apatococcus lobatus TaxID=904363 RepID=A0AAW1QLH4_9CHLO